MGDGPKTSLSVYTTISPTTASSANSKRRHYMCNYQDQNSQCSVVNQTSSIKMDDPSSIVPNEE